jgi:hypothetical protein
MWVHFQLLIVASQYHKHFQKLQLSFLRLPMQTPQWNGFILSYKSNMAHDPCMCHDHGVDSFFLAIQCDNPASTQTFTCKIIAKFWLCKNVHVLNTMQHNL